MQAARYKSLNPHWEAERGTEITLSRIYYLFLFFSSSQSLPLVLCHLILNGAGCVSMVILDGAFG